MIGQHGVKEDVQLERLTSELTMSAKLSQFLDITITHTLYNISYLFNNSYSKSASNQHHLQI